MKENLLFFELIRIAFGKKPALTHPPTVGDWEEVYQLAIKQTLTGLLFTAVEKLHEVNEAFMPPKPLMLQWFSNVLQIENQYKKIDNAAALLTRVFTESGFRCCVLKGQGIARLYPQPQRRQPGDVDLWVEGGRDKILMFLKKNGYVTGKVVIHHVDADIVNGVETEIHFMPGYTYNPFLHHRLQRFFQQHADEQFSNYNHELGFAYPTLRFNAVYILSHIYMHFLYEGIGLRQFVDYYMVLSRLSAKERWQATKDLHDVGLFRFAGAVMYVLEHVCGMEKDLMVAVPDAKQGQFLMQEIMLSGNFGKYDEHLKNRGRGLIRHNWVAFRRQLRFMKYYPVDILCIPFWKTGHWCWRKAKGYSR